VTRVRAQRISRQIIEDLLEFIDLRMTQEHSRSAPIVESDIAHPPVPTILPPPYQLDEVLSLTGAGPREYGRAASYLMSKPFPGEMESCLAIHRAVRPLTG
jgi:hypothetical protein